MAANQAERMLQDSGYREARARLLAEIARASAQVSRVRPPTDASDAARQAYVALLAAFQKDRGRDLYFPFLSSGLGHGPYVELVDGSVKLDLITGIGINFFGHAHPALMEESIDAVASDLLQGNLQPGIEARRSIEAILRAARSGKGDAAARLEHAWLATCGTMANEVALKIIRQKKFPAHKLFAFQDCFSGRSTAMQEITDSPAYRVGQPTHGFVDHLPFYDASLGLEASVARTVSRMREQTTRYAGQFAGLMIELIQGEGGVQAAPRDWYVQVFTEARKLNLAVWADEIQTFGRTGEYFAFQKFGLGDFIDVVTVGKMLKVCAAIYTAEYNPKPGLIAGTFSGTAAALRSSRRVLELLGEGGFLGEGGRIARASERFRTNLEKMRDGAQRGRIGEIRAIGGMIAFVPHEGKLDQCKQVLLKLFDRGAVAFYCGHGPYLIRLLPPMGTITDAQIDEACALIGEALA